MIAGFYSRFNYLFSQFDKFSQYFFKLWHALKFFFDRNNMLVLNAFKIQFDFFSL